MNARCTIEFADEVDSWNPKPLFASKDADFARSWKALGRTVTAHRLVKPGQTYSKRSTKLAQLRADATALAKLDLEEVTSPTYQAMQAAETFINHLWEGCLDFDLEVSHDGEINFLYGDNVEVFHIHIDENGALSFYCKLAESEMFGDEISAGEFPQNKLLSFVDRRK